VALNTFDRQNGAGNFAQAALGAVAGHSVADFFGTGIANADPLRLAFGAAQGLQHKSSHCDPLAARAALAVAAIG